MEADGALSTPLPLSVLRFTGIQSYSYTDQRKVEADIEVTEDRTGDLSLRKPRTSQLSHDCSLKGISVWLWTGIHYYVSGERGGHITSQSQHIIMRISIILLKSVW